MDFRERLLKHLNISKEEFAFRTREPSFSDLPSLPDNPTILRTRRRIMDAIAKKEPILIFGDYDCDGIMASSIMVSCLTTLGADVSCLIPSRYLDGYGLGKTTVQEILLRKPGLLLTVDNGISSVKEIEELQDSGIDVIVLDHHEIGPELPRAFSILHLDLIPFGKTPVSAGFLTYLFAKFLLRKDDPYLATLAALSTISDCMPLISYNQKLVALSLRFLRKYDFPTIRSLADDSPRIDERVLGMTIIPQINAVGRLLKERELDRLVAYFALFRNVESTAIWMKEQNEERKEMTKRAGSALSLDPDAPGIVALADLPEGLNGLLANRLLSEWGKTTIVFSPSFSEKGLLVGSLRANPGFSFVDFLEKTRPIIERGGGHDLAGGISLREENLEAFKEIFLSYCKEHPAEKKETEAMRIDVSEVTMENFRFLRSLGPFGHDNEEPRFDLVNVPTSFLGFSKNQEHMLATCENGVKIVGFRMPRSSFAFGNPFVTFHGRIGIDFYKQKPQLTFYADRKTQD